MLFDVDNNAVFGLEHTTFYCLRPKLPKIPRFHFAKLVVERSETEREMERAVNNKDYKTAQAIFTKLLEDGKKPTEFHYRCLIEAYSIVAKVEEALQVFGDMQVQGIYPNRLHMGSLIRVCDCHPST